MALAMVATRTARARAAPQTILYLTDAADVDRDVEAIREAVAIYTRDLHLDVSVEAVAPVAITAGSLGKVVDLVRARSARLAFWCRARAEEGDLVLYTVAIEEDRPEVHALRIAGSEGAELYRSVALKLRAVLTGNALLEPTAGTPPLPTVVTQAPPASSTAPVPTAVTVKPPQSGAGPSVEPRVLRPPRALVAVGYHLVLPSSDIGLSRQGLAVEIGRPFGHAFELHVGAEMTNEPQKRIEAGAASLLDVPVRLGARALVRVGRATVGLGPLLSAHVLSVSALGFDGTRGDALTVAAGLGGGLVGRLALTHELGIDLHLIAEAIVPPTTFVLHGSPSVDARGVLFGLGAGLVVAVP